MKFAEQMMLIAKGYSKKEIEELKKQEAEELANAATEKAPEEEPISQEESKEVEAEPDYKKLYEELQAKYEKTEKDLKDIQVNNTKVNAAPMAEKQKEEQEDALKNIARSFM